MKKRDLNLDLIRTLAIYFVVMNHAIEILYSFNIYNWKFSYNINSWIQISNLSRIFMVVMFTIGRLGVPLFLFITGSLILSKKIDTDEDILSFYKRNLLPLLIVNTVWIFIYNIVLLLTNNTHYITLDYIIKELFLLKEVPMSNMWYFPMIIGIYLVLPFMSKIIKLFSKKSINIILSVIFAYLFVVPMINNIFNILHVNNSLSPVINTSYFGGVYGLYVVLGYMIYTCNKERINISFTYIVGILSFIITVLFQLIAYYKGVGYNVWYNFPFLLICSLCLFNILLKVDTSKYSNKIKEFLTYTSKISLGIFFVHIIVLHFLAQLIVTFNIIMHLKVILLWLFTLVISYLIVYFLSKIKIISKYVLLIK